MGRAWLKTIEPVLITGPPDRALPRARALARRAIADLTIEANRVTARITDRGREHTITLNIPIWNDKEQTEVARTIGRAAPSRSGDLPDHLVTELTSVGARIAPRIDEITVTSDTGEASRWHVLAICYALVQKIDEEPELAIRPARRVIPQARRRASRRTAFCLSPPSTQGRSIGDPSDGSAFRREARFVWS